MIAQAVAREAGHLFGLRNVEDRDSVLFPTPGESRDDIGTPSNLAALADDGGIITFPFIQDIPLELENNLGLPTPSIVPIAALTGDLANVLTVEIGLDAPTLHEVRIAAVDPDDNILELAELGDLGSQDIAHFFAPVMDEDRIVLIAKSEAGGEFDLFLAPSGVESFTLEGLSEREVVDILGIRAADFANGVFSILGEDSVGLESPVQALTGLAAAPGVLGDRLANSLTAGDSGEALLGFGENDTLTGGAGADQIFGGDGDDRLLGAGGSDDLRGGDGDDVLDGGDGNDSLSGGAGEDSLRGGAGDDTLVAEIGEAIEGGEGEDTARISADFEGITITDTGDGFLFTTNVGAIEATGIETFIFDDQTVSVDAVNNMVNPDELLFDLSGSDALVADDVADTVRGGEGDDTISGSSGADMLLGEAGGDRLVGSSGSDTLDGGDGRDILEGGAGADQLLGGAEGDQLSGGDGDDIIQGDDGSDTLVGGDGADNIQGGDGSDVMIGGEGDDRIEGDAGDDTVDGGAGQDVAIGGLGADHLLGGVDDDTLRGEDGADDLEGGSGDDRLIGGGDNDTIQGGSGEDTLRGGQGADELLGGLGEDRLRSGGGDDALNGGGGADNARSGSGADNIRGGGGDDNLHGGGGADEINGGRGDDVLRGGGGADIFEFRTNDGDDTIRDFQQGRDKIKILRGAEEFSDLDLDQVGANVVISFANVSIIVERQDSDNFSDADFIL